MFRVFFLLFAVLFALSGCTGKTTVEQSGNAYTIYYLNTSGIQLVGSEYRTVSAPAIRLVFSGFSVEIQNSAACETIRNTIAALQQLC